MTAQTGLSLNNLPAFINDSIVGISIPQMDYINVLRIKYESAVEDRKYYSDNLITSLNELDKCRNTAQFQNATIDFLDKELKWAKINEGAFKLQLNNYERQVKKERRNKNAAWFTGGTVAVILLTLLIVK